MTKQESDFLTKKILEHRKRILRNKRTARKYLVKLGTHTKDGELTPEYRT